MPNESSRLLAADALGLGEPAALQKLRAFLNSRAGRTFISVAIWAAGVAIALTGSKRGTSGERSSRTVQSQPLREAFENLRQHHYAAAAARFSDGLRQTLTHDLEAQAHCGRGWAYVNTGHAADALADFDAALQLYPQLMEGFLGRGRALHQLGRMPEALAAYSEAIRLRPNLADTHFARAIFFRDVGRYDDAITDLDSALKVSPRSAALWSQRAFCHQRKQDFDAAFEDSAKAVEFEPDNVDAWYARAVFFIERGDPQAGVRELTASLERDPDSYFRLFARALVHLALEEIDAAEDDCLAAIRVKKDFAPAHALRADIEFGGGNVEGAIALANLAIELDPTVSLAHLVLGRAFDRRQDYSRALAEFEVAIENAPDWVTPRAYHAIARAHLGNYAAARQELEQLAVAFPANLDAHIFFAWFLSTAPANEFRDGPRARAEAEAAINLSNGGTPSLDVMATALAECGEFDRAVEVIDRAMNKTSSEGYRCLWREALRQEFRRHAAHVETPGDL